MAGFIGTLLTLTILALLVLIVILARQTRLARGAMEDVKRRLAEMRTPPPGAGDAPSPTLPLPMPVPIPPATAPEAAGPPPAPPKPRSPGGRVAYARGREDISSGGAFGGTAERMAWLLPLAVAKARGLTMARDTAFPAWDDLTHGEQRAVALLDRLRRAEPRAALDLLATDARVMLEIEGVIEGVAALHERAWDWDHFEAGLAAATRKERVQPLHHASILVRHVAWIVDGIAEARGAPPPYDPTPEDIALGEEGYLDRLARDPDPDLWHDLAAGLNPDDDFAADLYAWIAARPECDRGTAALIYALLDGPSWVGLDPAELDAAPGGAAIGILTARARADGFTTSVLGLELAGMRIDQRQRALAEDLAAREGGPGLPPATPLFLPPIEGRSPRSMWYLADDGAIARARF
ncbi:MAG: hypothetical protein ACU0CO_06025 [Shimia sp.]